MRRNLERSIASLTGPGTGTWSDPTHDAAAGTDAVPAAAGPMGHVELLHLARYAGVAVLVGAAALLFAWSRIDLRETAVALDTAEHRLARARSDRTRLQLERSSFVDPSWLSVAAQSMALDASAVIVTVPAVASAGGRQP